MKYEIDPDIIKSATQCDRNLECLIKEDQPSCKITECVNNKVHFLEELCRPCTYFIRYGFDSFICTCPVRKEIYNKFLEKNLL